MSHQRLLPAGNARDIYGQTIRANIKKSAEAREARNRAKDQKPKQAYHPSPKEKLMAYQPISCPHHPYIVKQQVSPYEYVAQCTYCGAGFSSLNTGDARYFTAQEISEGEYYKRQQQQAAMGSYVSYNIKFSVRPGQVYFPSVSDPAGVAAPRPKLDVARIDQLATVEARKVQPKIVIPDLTECIIGWRGWRVKETGDGLRLQGLGVDHNWEPKKPETATCRKPKSIYHSISGSWAWDDVVDKPHASPDKSCSCGVWAFRNLDEFKKMADSYHQTLVVGQVYLWGRVIECENGYRAERAYPKELWLLDSKDEELGLIYNVPIRSLGGK